MRSVNTLQCHRKYMDVSCPSCHDANEEPAEAISFTRQNLTALAFFNKKPTNLHLRIRPPWNLHNHVEDRLLLVCVERYIVEGTQWDAIPLDEDAVLECVGSADLARHVGHWHSAIVALLGDGKGSHREWSICRAYISDETKESTARTSQRAGVAVYGSGMSRSLLHRLTWM